MFQGFADSQGASVIPEEPPHPLVVVLNAVVTTVQHADVKAESFQKPSRQGVVPVVQNGLVQGQVPLHRVGPQAVGHHDVIDVVVRTLDALVQRPKLPGGPVQGYGANPGHGALEGTS